MDGPREERISSAQISRAQNLVLSLETQRPSTSPSRLSKAFSFDKEWDRLVRSASPGEDGRTKAFTKAFTEALDVFMNKRQGEDVGD